MPAKKTAIEARYHGPDAGTSTGNLPEPYTGVTGGYVELVALLKDLQRRFIAGSDIHKKLEHAINLAE